jgi:hypothetical protein
MVNRRTFDVLEDELGRERKGRVSHGRFVRSRSVTEGRPTHFDPTSANVPSSQIALNGGLDTAHPSVRQRRSVVPQDPGIVQEERLRCPGRTELRRHSTLRVPIDGKDHSLPLAKPRQLLRRFLGTGRHADEKDFIQSIGRVHSIDLVQILLCGLAPGRKKQDDGAPTLVIVVHDEAVTTQRLERDGAHGLPQVERRCGHAPEQYGAQTNGGDNSAELR